MPQTNIYVGIEPRIGFADADRSILACLVQDWVDARFPNGIFHYETCIVHNKLLQTFYDSDHRFWSVITRMENTSV